MQCTNMLCDWNYPIDISLREFLIILSLSFTALWATLAYTRDWRTQRSRLVKLAECLPGPPTLPLVGNALRFACKPEQLLDRVVGVIAPYADVSPMRVWMGPALCVVITAPRDIEIVLNSQQATSKSAGYAFLHPLIGDGLISGSGPHWRSHRKMFARTLNPRILRDYVASSDRHSRILVEKLKSFADGRVFDILEMFEGCTIDIVCEAVMGCTDINAQHNPDQEFVHSTSEMYNIVYDRMMKIWLHPDCIFNLTERYKRQCKAMRVIHNFTEKCISAKKSDLAMTKSFTAELSSTTNDGDSVLERILKMNNVTHELSDVELRDEIYTVYLAAQDTLALTCSFATLMLAMHEDVQTKARQEVQEVFANDEPVTIESLGRLKYVEMVVKEALRLFPIAPLLGRCLLDELTLDNCTLPKNCEIIIASYVTHRSEKYWKNPERFEPERFTAEEIAKRHPYTFVPFSGGAMSCIGQKFALMSVKTVLAHLLQNYRITTSVRMQDVKLRSDISIRSIDGYKVSLEPLGKS